MEAPFALLTTVITMFALLRLGTLAVAVAFVVVGLLNAYPITLDLSKWYAPHSLFMFAALLALLFYGLRLASGKQSAAGGMNLLTPDRGWVIVEVLQ